MSADVLVTGAAGFIGSHVARECLAAGWRVAAVDIREPDPDVLERTDFRRCDAAERAVLEEIRDQRYSAVLHQAGISDTAKNDWAELEQHNVHAALALARACAEGNARLVYASSHSVYGQITQRVPISEEAVDDPAACSGPLNLYARSKLVLDRLMQRTFPEGLEWYGLRYTNVFGTGEQRKGPMASIISQLLRASAQRRPLSVFADTLSACRDYVPVGTVARYCERLLDAPATPGIYNLGSGHATSFATLLEWCAEFAEADTLEVRLIPNPVRDCYQFWTCADISKLVMSLPNEPMPEAVDVKSSARRLFAHFSRFGDPAAGQSPARLSGC